MVPHQRQADPTGGYDLLAADEVGHFALANSLADAGAADSYLLLGDPQQQR